MSVAVRHQAAMARREANAIRQARAEEKRQLRAEKHGYRLSDYPRADSDFYPTPVSLAAALAVGLPQLGVRLPVIALDPCGGGGALRRGLAPFGIDVRLADLYREKYPVADGYVTYEMLDAGHAASLRFSLDLAGPNCRAIVTNSPHETSAAIAIVKNSIALAEEGRVDVVAALFRSIWGAEPGRLSLLSRPSFLGEVLCCWRARWIPGTEASPMHAYSWFVWGSALKTVRPSLTVRIGEAEAVAATIAAMAREAA